MIVGIDPATGATRVITPTHTVDIPSGIVAAPDGRAFMTDEGSGDAVVQVDLATGAASPLAAGPPLRDPTGVDLFPNGAIASATTRQGPASAAQPFDSIPAPAAHRPCCSRAIRRKPSRARRSLRRRDLPRGLRGLTPWLRLVQRGVPARSGDGRPFDGRLGGRRTAVRRRRGRAPALPGRPATIVGSTANDRIVGSPFNDVIAVLGGKDRVNAGKGRDFVCGGAGKDKLKGGKGKDRLIGGGGKDTCSGGKGKDRAKSARGASSHGPRSVMVSSHGVRLLLRGSRWPSSRTSGGRWPGWQLVLSGPVEPNAGVCGDAGGDGRRCERDLARGAPVPRAHPAVTGPPASRQGCGSRRTVGCSSPSLNGPSLLRVDPVGGVRTPLGLGGAVRQPRRRRRRGQRPTLLTDQDAGGGALYRVDPPAERARRWQQVRRSTGQATSPSRPAADPRCRHRVWPRRVRRLRLWCAVPRRPDDRRANDLGIGPAVRQPIQRRRRASRSARARSATIVGSPRGTGSPALTSTM